ncbi:MFS sugar transporter [Fusarium beomiforme]|uniref:MFS sugar transporter n=1 Tax=Fusarium beomiforme TaxID=44412 RepID=A0A9P5ALT0_9HYPO|nr:MFS sugar transporter [Fusarium beomiforme]
MPAVWTLVFQQICGVDTVAFYTTIIFQVCLDMDPVKSRILAAAMSTFQLIGGGGLSSFTIDSFGRRKLMLISFGGMAVLIAVLAITTAMQSHKAALIFAVVALFLYLFIFAWGFAGLTFLHATEVAPPQYRGDYQRALHGSHLVSNFLIAQVTPVEFDALEYRYYIIFACIKTAFFPTTFFLPPRHVGYR